MRSLRNLTPEARRSMLKDEGATDSSFASLQQRSLADWAARLDDASENVIGSFPMPLSAVRMRVNGRDRVIPLVTEEKGVVAGIAKAAKLVEQSGFNVRVEKAVACATILFSGYADRDADAFVERIGDSRTKALEIIRAACGRDLERHGRKLHNPIFQCRVVTDIVHVEKRPVEILIGFEVGESMGARFVTAMAERCGHVLAYEYGARYDTAIVTNGGTGRLVEGQAAWNLTGQERRARGLVRIADWARGSDLRATTHDKGVMNGIEAVAIAMGQDIRAIHAAATCHPFPFRPPNRRDRPLTYFTPCKDGVSGGIFMRLPAATVGGATRHPMVVQCRQMAGITDAADLAAVMAAVGLAANFASLYQLSDPDGFSQTYRKLEKRP